MGLEQENRELLDESRALKAETEGIHRKERDLIKQCFDQLGSANRKIEILNTESQQRENANYALGKYQSCRGNGNTHGDSHSHGMGMGMGKIFSLWGSP